MRRYLLGQRFVDPEIEREYRSWRRQETFPLIWLGMWAATLSWLATPGAMAWLTPELYPQVREAVLYLFIPLYVVLTLCGFVRPVRRYALPTITCANCLAGFIMIWLSYSVGGSLGATVASTMLILFYAPFIRLPPENLLIAGMPYILVTTVLVVQNVDTIALPAERFVYMVVPPMSLLTVMLVCAVLEFFLRKEYTRVCLISSQQTSLENAATQIRRYLPPAVADQIAAGKEAEISTPRRRRVTILFSDIVGFTDIADRVEPEVMTQIISDYMAAMSEIIDQHQGTVNEFIGDGLMALFGAPNELAPEAQARQAILSAQAMQTRLPELNRQWRKLGLSEALQIRIGINTGMSSVGSYGSEGRMTYTAIGLQTNIAARIQSKCEPGSILISDATYQLIDDVIDCEPKGEIECKGVHYPVKVYAPKDKE